jgi:DNA-binding PadR family transcriptional regulator
MSQKAIKITLICEPKVEENIENALANLGIQFTKEEVKKPIEAHIIYIPEAMGVLFVTLHILEAKKDVVKGSIELADGKKYELTQEGRDQLNGLLIEAMSRKREEAPTQLAWWTPFIPEIKELLKTIIKLIEWYPKAIGEGKRIVTRNFLIVIGAIVIGMGFLTYTGKISGDSFVFVIGALLGYIFAFLERFLGILIHD